MYDIPSLALCLMVSGIFREIPNITSFQNSLDQLESPLLLKTMTRQSCYIRLEAQIRETLLEGDNSLFQS